MIANTVGIVVIVEKCIEYSVEYFDKFENENKLPFLQTYELCKYSDFHIRDN